MGSALRRLLRLDEAALAGSPEAEAELEQLIDEHEDALFALAEAETTTIAGAVALLRYVAEIERVEPDRLHRKFEDDAGSKAYWSHFMHHNLAEALENLTASSPGARHDPHRDQ